MVTVDLGSSAPLVVVMFDVRRVIPLVLGEILLTLEDMLQALSVMRPDLHLHLLVLRKLLHVSMNIPGYVCACRRLTDQVRALGLTLAFAGSMTQSSALGVAGDAKMPAQVVVEPFSKS